MAGATNRTGGSARRAPVPPRGPRRGDLGLGALILSAVPTPPPATNASWAWSMRRLGRAMLGAVPLYAVVFGLVTLGPFHGEDLRGRDLATYLAEGQWLRLTGWLGAVWLGLMAMAAITALLAATRSRRSAAAGLMLGVAAAALTLPFAALPEDARVGVVDARTLVLIGAAVHSAAWAVTGWAVARCRALAASDGVVLIVAAPMLGIAGLLVGPLQTVGALLALAAGLGIVWRAGRSLPTVETAPEAASAGPDAAVATAV